MICKVYGYSGLFAARSDVKKSFLLCLCHSQYFQSLTRADFISKRMRVHDARWVHEVVRRGLDFIVTYLTFYLSSANATLEKSKMKKDLDSLKSHVLEVERLVLVKKDYG